MITEETLVVCEGVSHGGQLILDSPLPYRDGTRVQVQVTQQGPCPCEREEAAYARERERLIRQHLGEFVVLYRDELLGPFATYDRAIQEGYGRFGDVQIVVKQIEASFLYEGRRGRLTIRDTPGGLFGWVKRWLQ